MRIGLERVQWGALVGRGTQRSSNVTKTMIRFVERLRVGVRDQSKGYGEVRERVRVRVRFQGRMKNGRTYLSSLRANSRALSVALR